jgi:hypothetical protein
MATTGMLCDIQRRLVNIIALQLTDVKEELGDIVNVLEKRSLLHNVIVYLTRTMINAAFSGVIDALQQQIMMCPVSYQFDEPQNTYVRVFSSSDNMPNLSTELLIFLCHVDFSQNHMSGREEHCCPLYAFCNESLRQKKSEILKTKPRLSYEHQENLVDVTTVWVLFT